MRFEVELALAGKRFKYTISFEWPPEVPRGTHLWMKAYSVDGSAIFTRHQAQVQLSGGSTFGLDWHIFALPVINERPPARSIQDVKAFFASMVLIAPVPA